MEALCIYFYMKEGGNKMKLIMSLLEKYLMPFSNKITSNKLLNAIKDACILQTNNLPADLLDLPTNLPR